MYLYLLSILQIIRTITDCFSEFSLFIHAQRNRIDKNPCSDGCRQKNISILNSFRGTV